MKGFFQRLFGQSAASEVVRVADDTAKVQPDLTAREREWQRTLDEEELADLLEQGRQPALHLRKTPHRAGPGAPGCWFGGKPTLPSEIAWPIFHSGEGLAIPMQFFAQVNLAEVPRLEGMPAFPEKGTLYFFLDRLLGDLNGWQPECQRVIYVPGDVSDLPERDRPPLPDLAILDEYAAAELWWHSKEPGGNHPNMPRLVYPKWCFTFEPFEVIERYQPLNRDFYEAVDALDEARFKALEARTAEDRNVEGQEDWASEFVDNMMFGDTRKEDHDLVSLLKLIPDMDTGFGFHPDYEWAAQFLISNGDLAAGNFDNVRMDDLPANQV